MDTNTEKWSGKPPKAWAYHNEQTMQDLLRPREVTIEPVQRVEPGQKSRVPNSGPRSIAEGQLSAYCNAAELFPDEYPLSEPWACLTDCPECEQERPMALSDYICIGCRGRVNA